MSILTNIRTVQRRIEAAARRAGRAPGSVTLIAVTKSAAPEEARAAYGAGIRHFGENRVQDAEGRMEALAAIRDSVTWHMVGHLQTNKVPAAARLFAIIHSVDSIRLGQVLDRRFHERRPVLLEVNIAGEATKHGLREGELPQALDALSRCANLDIRGLMTMAPQVQDPEQARPVFRRLRELARQFGLPELSMGMTDDFEVAIEEGATMVRIGRAIFGPRST
ncbi:MAG: YggS family pyridoxal phosphate-dependent enzyme [Chloroflexi bacterium]|nr:YggS family pyridoxal phosphate-dependent enzyme [Chloroflexota bacterium]